MRLTDKWRKSKRSGSGGNCVEVRATGEGVEVRDSKHPEEATLTFTGEAWRAFVADIGRGAYDL